MYCDYELALINYMSSRATEELLSKQKTAVNRLIRLF